MLDRRTFIGSASALGLATAAGAATRQGYSKNAYSRALVIDGLGVKGIPEPRFGA